jgi:hypothetical protein
MSILLLIATLLVTQSTDQANKPPAMSVTISAASETVKVGSELRIKILITNKSDHEILLGKPAGKAGQGEFLNLIEVRDERGNAVPKTRYYRQIRGEEYVPVGVYVSTIGFSVKPGESMEEEAIVSKLYDLDKVGKYRIQTQHDDPDNKALVKSNTITVTVTP